MAPSHPQPPTADTPPPSTAGYLAEVHEEISGLFEQVSDPGADRPAVLQLLIRRMVAHTSAEKQHLVPELEALDDGGPGGQLSGDNRDMEKLLGLIERRSVTSPDMVDLVNELLAAWDRHLAHYADEVEPLLRPEGSLAGDRGLAERTGAELAGADAHPHPLLPDSGPLGRAGRAVASAIDAARNRTIDR